MIPWIEGEEKVFNEDRFGGKTSFCCLSFIPPKFGSRKDELSVIFWKLPEGNLFAVPPNMSSAPLTNKEKDIQMMLACLTHIGTKNADFQMEPYIWKRRLDGKFRTDSYTIQSRDMSV